MPRMLPSRPDPDSPDSEKRVFKILERELPGDWVCIHSRRFVIPPTPGRKAREGEVDFIVLHPERGYACLEVKGGYIERDEHNNWHSTDRNDQRHPIADPSKQASRGCHSIKDYLREKLPGSALHYSWGVIFPDSYTEVALGPDLPRDIIIDRANLGNIESQLEVLFDHWKAPDTKIPMSLKQDFERALMPAFSLVPLLKNRIDEEAVELVRMTEEQKVALDYCQANLRVGVEGGAGTGKTILAMEKARRLAEEGLRVRFLCYNKPLADSLNEAAEGFVVTNFHELCSELAIEANLGFKVPGERDQVGKFWNEDAPELLIKALELLPETRYDAVIIDEGQDFKEHWWTAILDLLARRDESHLYVFHDPNQDIYHGEFSSDLNLTPVTLKWNCRNTIRIARYCSGVLEQDATTRPDAPEGLPVTEQEVRSRDQMVETVRKLLHRYVNEEGIPPEKIAVLTGRSLKRSAVKKAGKLGNHELIQLGNKRKPNSVLISTLHRFKGLEADVVIVCDIDRSSKRFDPKELYVAASRAKHVLAVIEYATAEDAKANPGDKAAVA